MGTSAGSHCGRGRGRLGRPPRCMMHVVRGAPPAVPPGPRAPREQGPRSPGLFSHQQRSGRPSSSRGTASLSGCCRRPWTRPPPPRRSQGSPAAERSVSGPHAAEGRLGPLCSGLCPVRDVSEPERDSQLLTPQSLASAAGRARLLSFWLKRCPSSGGSSVLSHKAN